MFLKHNDKQTIKPVLIVVSILITLIVTVATRWAKIERIWLVFPFSEIRISTVIIALACFALVLFMQRGNTLKSIYYASLGVVFSLALFEILWYYSAAAAGGWDLRIFQFSALFGWVVLGIREVFPKRPPKVSVVLYGVFVISMAIWVGTGFSFNDLSNPSFSVSAEVLNVLAKASLFVAYAFHIGSAKS